MKQAVEVAASAQVTISEKVLLTVLTNKSLTLGVRKERCKKRHDKIVGFEKQHNVNIREKLFPVIWQEAMATMMSS